MQNEKLSGKKCCPRQGFFVAFSIGSNGVIEISVHHRFKKIEKSDSF